MSEKASDLSPRSKVQMFYLWEAASRKKEVIGSHGSALEAGLSLPELQ